MARGSPWQILVAVLAASVAWLVLAHPSASIDRHFPDGDSSASVTGVVAKASDAVSLEEEAEEAEAASEGGEDVETTPSPHGGEKDKHEEALVTTSYLLIGFLVVNFVLLYLVNYPDANVRSYTWQMISGTISIYLAVVMDGSISKVVKTMFATLTKVAEEDEEDAEKCAYAHKVAALLDFLMFVAFAAGVNFLCYKARHRKKYLYATSIIGGHLTAFALTKGWIDLVNAGDGLRWYIPVLVLFAALGARVACRCLRQKVLGARVAEEDEKAKLIDNRGVDADRAQQDQGRAQEHIAEGQERSASEEEAWVEMATEAEDEASAIVQSFVISELVIAAYFSGDVEAPHSTGDIIKMFGAEGVCFLVLVSSACTEKLVLKRLTKHRESMERNVFDRIVHNVEMTLAMTMSWLAKTLFFWISCYLFPTAGIGFTVIISAAILTACSVVGIIVLDMFADRVEDSEGDPLVQQIAGRVDLGGESLAKSDVVKEALDLKNLERGIRAVINSIALSVGLAWEHGFHESTHTIVDTTPALKANPVCSNTLVALLSVALMLPVWLKYIVKYAMKKVAEHQGMMNEDGRQVGHI